jgi:hypothetical protein
MRGMIINTCSAPFRMDSEEIFVELILMRGADAGSR